MADDRLEIVDSERRLDGWLAVDLLRLRHRRFDGAWTPILERTVVRRGGAVVVLPYDPARDEVVLIEQFRAGAVADTTTAWLIETVAGLRDQQGSAEATARRELVEEAGLEAKDVLQLWEGYSTPGFADEYLWGFVARVDSTEVVGHHGLDEEDEDIRPFVLGFDEAMAWWRAGRLRNVPLITTLLALAAERPRLRAAWGAS
jgi:ADP-ribose pyrophosphatase